MLVFVGLPIFYLELFVGQYTGLGPLKTFGAIAPFFSGVGYCTLVVMTIVLIQFMVIIAWSSFYTFMSIGGNIDWGSCNNTFNSISKCILINTHI